MADQLPVLKKGSTGADVAVLQTILKLEPDGDFGDGTDKAVRDFQKAHALGADGVVGDGTWKELLKLLAKPGDEPKYTGGLTDIWDKITKKEPTPAPAPVQTTTPREQILTIADASKALHHSFGGKGTAPRGWIRGIALTFHRSLTRLRRGEAVALQMAKADTNDDALDALSWYQSRFRPLGIKNDKPGEDTLRHLYTLIAGLGMRESDGGQDIGRDHSAHNVTSDTAEGGPLQMSWNIHPHAPLVVTLFDEYKGANAPDGLADVFYEGIHHTTRNLENFGSGTGRDFQELAKSSPAFAVEAAAVGLRSRRDHWGPINRHEAEVSADVDDMLKKVQEL